MARWFVHAKGKSEKLITKPNSSSPTEWNYKKEKAREFQKNIYFCFIDYAKAFDVWITINCGKF